MTPIRARRLAPGWIACLSLGSALTACAAEEPAEQETEKEMLVLHGLVQGERWPGPEEKLYSQGNEELIIRDFFQDRRKGFFLDVGASDPIRGSTTYYLEKHLGWSGIGIDALPEFGPMFAEKRPRTRFENLIVTDHSGTIEEFYRVGVAKGLSSTEKEREILGMKMKGEKLRVPTVTLNELLEKHGVEKIDFISMDIEGSEPKALAAFDIERYRPELVCVEQAFSPKFIQEYFAEHGYERIEKYRKYDYVNWYFRPADSGD